MLKRLFIPNRCLFHGSESILVPKMTWGKGPKSSLRPKSTKNDMVWGGVHAGYAVKLCIQAMHSGYAFIQAIHSGHSGFRAGCKDKHFLKNMSGTMPKDAA